MWLKFKNFLKMVESLLFIGAGAGVGAGEKKMDPVKNEPAPQRCIRVMQKF